MSTSGINQRGGGFDDPRPVAEIRIAAVAAAAARAIPGVAHLQPGLWGPVQQLGTDLWTRVTGKPRPYTGGVEVVGRVRSDGPAVRQARGLGESAKPITFVASPAETFASDKLPVCTS